MTSHRVIFGDSRSMKKIEDGSVNLIITSPPYWQLKDYGADDQIGFNDSYEEYINNLNLVWKECDRVLSNGCRLCINIGDQFARSAYYGRYKVIPIRTEIIRFCETLGMDYMGAIIWQKVTTMNSSGGGAVMGSFPYPRNGIIKMDYEFILIFKKQGTPPKVTDEQKKASAMTKDEWNEYFSSHWNFSGVRQSEHIAMFPEELPKRLIKMFSFVGETVLDPFLGSGTTSKAAMSLGRNSVGYEINRDFGSIIEEKLSGNLFDGDRNIVFENDESRDFSFNSLPYLFFDPHKIDKKVDIKKNQYGSIIDRESQRKQFFSVKKVVSPNSILLTNGVTVVLLGVIEKKESWDRAVKFLEEKIGKHRVYMTYDDAVQCCESEKKCYLYLDNRTFVNRHLIETGYVAVDTSIDYKYKKKFMEKVYNG